MLIYHFFFSFRALRPFANALVIKFHPIRPPILPFALFNKVMVVFRMGEVAKNYHIVFVITRVAAPGTWWFGLISNLYSVLGLWFTAAAAVYAAVVGWSRWPLWGWWA